MTVPSENATKPRGRGRTPSFDRTEALDIALELFWRHGYEGVGIADLTRAIGIAPPSLYHAFGSKADLYREVLRRYGSGGLSPDEIEATPSAYEAASRMLLRGVAAVTAPGRPLGCMVSSGMLMTSAENADLAAELRSMRAATREALARRIGADVENGALPRAVEPESLARFVVAVLQGLSVQAIDGASAADLTAAASAALARWPSSTSEDAANPSLPRPRRSRAKPA